MQTTQHFHDKVEKVINTDNFYEGNKSVSQEDKRVILAEVEEIENEQSKEIKISKWEKFIQKWAGTISEVATPILKELLIAK